MHSKDGIVRIGWAFAFLGALATGACMAGSSAGKLDGESGSGGDSTLFNNGGHVADDPVDLPEPNSCANDGSCPDFPAEPLFEGGASTDAPTLFGPVDPDKFTGPSPCVLEPQLSSGETPGAMVPANWLTPRFRFTVPGDLFEIRVTAASQQNDFVVYTTTPEWTMPSDVWKPAAENTAGKAMSITIRAITTADPSVQSGVQGDILIAPVNAGGSMVFWTVKDANVTPDSSKLYGFSVGDEGVTEVLRSKTVEFSDILHEGGSHLRGEYGGAKPGFEPGEVQCIGCHISTPDGAAVVFTDDWPWNKAIASVEPDTAGKIPSYLTPGARALLKMPWLGTQAMTPAYFTDGNRLLLASYAERSQPFSSTSAQNDRLIWIDLETAAEISDEVPAAGDNPEQAKDDRNAAITAAEGTAWAKLAMEGEPANAVTPTWSHDGTRVVYVSTDDSPNGHTSSNSTTADLYSVPFASGDGGAVQPVSGASHPDYYEYYPGFSADDKLLVFNRAPKKSAGSSICPGTSCPDGAYYNRYGEINVIPSDGGTPTPLVANAPVACAGDDVSAGLLNSWPKWSPQATTVDGKTYYFVIFSSARKYPGSFDIPQGQWTPPTLDTRSSQLYMAAVVVDDASGAITSYPAVYLWNQNRLVVGDTAVEEQTSNLTPAWDEFVIPDVPDIPL